MINLIDHQSTSPHLFSDVFGEKAFPQILSVDFANQLGCLNHKMGNNEIAEKSKQIVANYYFNQFDIKYFAKMFESEKGIYNKNLQCWRPFQKSSYNELSLEMELLDDETQ